MGSNGSNGSTLTQGGVLNVGDYLISPDGSSKLTLLKDGLHLDWLWKFSRQDNPFTVWNSGLYAGASSLYLVMQFDGNLCIYAGSPAQPGQLLWQCGVAPGPGRDYRAVIQDDGNFCVYPDGGSPSTWCTGCAKKPQGLVNVQGIYGAPPADALYLTAPAGDPKVGMACTMERPSSDKAARQTFQQIDLIVNNQPYGFLLRGNVDYGWPWGLVGAIPMEGKQVGMLASISNQTILIRVDPGTLIPEWTGIRPIGGGDLHFNVPGDGPYKPGASIIMYHWARPATSNEVWAIRFIS
jgi:hypothetical protein